MFRGLLDARYRTKLKLDLPRTKLRTIDFTRYTLLLQKNNLAILGTAITVSLKKCKKVFQRCL